ASAVSADCPRIDCATRLSLRGLVRMARPTARACVSHNARLRAGLPTFGSPFFRLGDLGFAVARVAVENPRRRELAEFVTDHVFGHHHRDVLLAVVDAEGQTDELRQNRRTPRPDLDHFLASRIARDFRLLEHEAVDKRTFPNRTSHGPTLALFSNAASARCFCRSACSCGSWRLWWACPTASPDGARPWCGPRRRHGGDRSGS